MTIPRFLPALPLIVALVLAGAGALAHAGGAPAGITLSHPWIRATPAGAAVAGGFVEIRNDGAFADRLVGGSADFAARVEIHEMAMDGEIMRMRALKDGLAIAPGATVMLKPGSYHVMFMKLARPLVAGETVGGTLVFEKAGAQALVWQVVPMGASAPAAMGAMPAK